jgi:hypothetical protein
MPKERGVLSTKRLTAADLNLWYLIPFLLRYVSINIEEAEEWITRYKRFLDFVRVNGTTAGSDLLTWKTDMVWHSHILHTRQYAEDCEKLFGRFLHHTPETGGLPLGVVRIHERACYSSERGGMVCG